MNPQPFDHTATERDVHQCEGDCQYMTNTHNGELASVSPEGKPFSDSYEFRYSGNPPSGTVQINWAENNREARCRRQHSYVNLHYNLNPHRVEPSEWITYHSLWRVKAALLTNGKAWETLQDLAREEAHLYQAVSPHQLFTVGGDDTTNGRYGTYFGTIDFNWPWAKQGCLAINFAKRDRPQRIVGTWVISPKDDNWLQCGHDFFCYWWDQSPNERFSRNDDKGS